MNADLPSYTVVCATIQREEVRKKVMNLEVKSNIPEARACASSLQPSEARSFKGKKGDMRCSHCNYTTHMVDTCWILHP